MRRARPAEILPTQPNPHAGNSRSLPTWGRRPLSWAGTTRRHNGTKFSSRTCKFSPNREFVRVGAHLEHNRALRRGRRAAQPDRSKSIRNAGRSVRAGTKAMAKARLNGQSQGQGGNRGNNRQGASNGQQQGASNGQQQRGAGGQQQGTQQAQSTNESKKKNKN